MIFICQMLCQGLGGQTLFVKFYKYWDKKNLDFIHSMELKRQIYTAAKGGDVDTLHYLLDNWPADINHHDECGDNAFMLSAGHGHIECVRCLYATGHIDVNHPNQNGNTALMLSAGYGHVNCVKWLLHSDQVDVNHPNQHGNTAFILSARYGMLSVSDVYLPQGK